MNICSTGTYWHVVSNGGGDGDVLTEELTVDAPCLLSRVPASGQFACPHVKLKETVNFIFYLVPYYFSLVVSSLLIF